MITDEFDKSFALADQALARLRQQLAVPLEGPGPVGESLDALSSALDRMRNVCVEHDRGAQEQREALVAQAEAEHRRAEEAVTRLERERNTLEAVLEATQAEIAYLDPELNFVMVNSAYARGSGHTKEELIGRNHFDLFPYADNRALFERVRDTRQPAAFHARPFEYVDQPERSVTYWDWVLVPVQDAGGQVQGLVFSLMDVTQQVRDEQHVDSLRAQAQRQADEMAAAFDSIAHPLIVWDSQGFARRANPAAQAAFGLDPAGTHISAIAQQLRFSYPNGQPIPVDDIPVVRALRGETVRERHELFHSLAGEERHRMLTTAPIISEGRIVGAVASWRDVTEQRMVEQERDRLIEIVEATPDLVFTARLDGELVYVNRAARTVLDVPPGAVVGEGTIAERYPEWADALIQNEGLPTAVQQGHWLGETAVVGRDGHEIPLSQLILAHPGPDGAVEMVSTLARDISRQKEMEALIARERAQLEAVIQQMPAGVMIVEAGTGRILLVNRQFLEIAGAHGTPANLAESWAQYHVLRPDGQAYQPAEYPLSRSLVLGQVVTGEEMVISRADGTQATISASTAPIRNERGQILAAVSVFADVTQAGQLREALRQERDFASAVLDTTAALVIVLDRQGRVVRFNRACEQLTGYSFEEIRGTRLWELLLDPEEADSVEAVLRELAAGSFPNQNENYWVARDGTRHLIAFSNTALVDESGEVQFLIGTGLDITAGRQAQEALRRTRDELAAIFGALTEPVMVADEQGRYVRANPAAQAALGMDPAELPEADLSRGVKIRYPDGSPIPADDLAVAHALRGETVRDMEQLLLTTPGDERNILVSAAPMRQEDRIGGAVLAWHDVTPLKQLAAERERLAAEVAVQRAFLERLIDEAPIGIAVVRGPDHRYELANPYYRALVGLPAADIIGRTTLEVIPDLARKRMPPLLDKVYRTGQTVSTHEVPVSFPSGRGEQFMDTDRVPLRGPDGSVDGILIMARDVTQQVEVRRRVEALSAQARRQADQLDAIFTALTEPMMVSDDQGRYTRANPAAVRALGLDTVGLREAEVGQRVTACYPDRRPIPPDDLVAVRALRGETVHDMEQLLLSTPGEEQAILASAAPIRSEGKISGAVVAWHEVTHLKRTEAALRESEAKLRTIIDLLPLGLSVVDAERRVVFSNPALERILGLSREELEQGRYRSRTSLRADGSVRPDEELPTYRAIHDGLRVDDVEVGVVKDDDQVLWTSVSATPVSFGNWRAIVTTADITPRKLAEEALRQARDELEHRVHVRTHELYEANEELRAEIVERAHVEEELRRSEEQFRQLADNIHELFWLLDVVENRMLYVSPAYMEITGQSPLPLYDDASHLLDSVYIADRERVSAALAWHASGYDLEYRVLRPDESLRWVRARAFPIHDPQGKAYRVAGIAEDVTDQVNAYRILEGRVEERTRELSTLLEISNTVALSMDLEPLLTLILDSLKRVVSFTGVAVFIAEQGTLVPAANQGPVPAEAVLSLQGTLQEAEAGRPVSIPAGPVSIPDVQKVPEFERARALLRAEGDVLIPAVRSWLVIPLQLKERSEGLLVLYSRKVRAFDSSQIELAGAFATQAAVAIANTRLYDQVGEMAAMEERQRLARELHDAVTQTLFSASLAAEVLPRLWDRDREAGLRCLSEVHQLTRGALAEMRTLLLELRPSALVETDLGALLQQLAQAVNSRARIPITVEAAPRCVLPPETQVAFYRIAQEALNNMAKHAGARCAAIRLRCEPPVQKAGAGLYTAVELSISDDGCGFDVEAVMQGGKGMGLGIMRERAAAVGAVLHVESAPGHGSRITVTWPEEKRQTL